MSIGSSGGPGPCSVAHPRRGACHVAGLTQSIDHPPTHISNREDSHGRLSESGGGVLQQGSSQQAAAPTLCGQALYRLPGLASALFKEWKPGFWVLKGEKLLLFESKAAYEQSKLPGSAAASSSSSLLKQQVPLAEGLVVGELKYKEYGPKFGALHHFTVDNRRDGATR